VIAACIVRSPFWTQFCPYLFWWPAFCVDTSAISDDGNIRVFSVPTQEDGQDGVLVQIADNGMGISDGMKSKLFTPFATTKEEGGSGLGLWVSRAILEKHEGSIRVASAESGYLGTTVSIFLPLKLKSIF
jgi:signal transduction histidine kinase